MYRGLQLWCYFGYVFVRFHGGTSYGVFLVEKQEHHLPKAGGIFAKKSIRGIE